MSDNLFPNVGGVEFSSPPPAKAVKTGKKASAKTNTKPAKPVKSLGDISLKFKIDANTNDVTVLILDRSNRRVVRTIPPEEMKELNPGDLLELFG